MQFDPNSLKIKIFADGADLENMLRMSRNPLIKGLTTNPSLMRKAGVTNYQAFALQVLENISDKPISFEVFADEFDEMILQGKQISSWGKNVYVKIPITNTKGQSTFPVVKQLVSIGCKVNITAVMTEEQVFNIREALDQDVPAYVSVFAGRIADTGQDPVNLISNVLNLLKPYSQTEVIWASPREILNVFQAEKIGCHVITATYDILSKLSLIGKDLEQYSLETVQMFYNDSIASNYNIN